MVNLTDKFTLSTTDDLKYDGLECEIEGGTLADLQDYVEGFTSFMSITDWDYMKVKNDLFRSGSLSIIVYKNDCYFVEISIPGIIGHDIDPEDLTFFNVNNEEI